ncbi:MAG: site-specific integrase [Cyanobacteria bacterium P01_A01_bin.105]
MSAAPKSPTALPDLAIDKLNQRLKAAQMGLKIERRGEKLSLRGTLPPRPNSPRLKPYQQRLPLGLPATKAGLKQAEQTAKVIAAQLIQNTFDWRDYLGPVAGLKLAGASLVDAIDAFEKQFFLDRQDSDKPASVRTTWEKAYVPYLRKLVATTGQQSNLTLPEAIYATVQGTRANSRSRQTCCTALGALAEFMNLELPTDLKSFWGRYGSSKTQLRNLPTDAEIVAAHGLIPNPAWQFVYGMMATYGLRNHEVFFCDTANLKLGHGEAVVEVLETTKTGNHEVWPFYAEWVDRFNLREVNLPNIKTDLTQTTPQRVGQQVTTQFRRYGIPFSPYDLRHAWAVRTILFGLPDTVAARMMGHSVQIHTRTYHRWMTHRDQQAAVAAARSRNSLEAPV